MLSLSTVISAVSVKTVNMHETKTNFSRLVEAALQGEQVTIAKAGHPMVKLVRVEAEDSPARTGFLQGQGRIPEDFDTIHGEAISALFEGRS